MIKLFLIIAAFGHIICGITDCMMAYTKNGRFDFEDIKDSRRMNHIFSVMPLRQLEISMMAGIVALFLASIGYIGLADWMIEYSFTASLIMKISGLFFISLITAHHVLCGAVEWFYVKFGITKEALSNVVEFFKKTGFAAVAYVGLLIYVVTLFVVVVTGKTKLPCWACIFNTLLAFLILAPTKLPAKGNIANAFMFLGLSFLI